MRHFILDDVAHAMLFVQARSDALVYGEVARRSAAKALPTAPAEEELPPAQAEQQAQPPPSPIASIEVKF